MSVGDIIALIALVVGLNALLFTLVFSRYEAINSRIRKENARLSADLLRIERNSERIESVVNGVVNCVKAEHVASKFFESQIKRSLRSAHDQELLSRVDKGFSEFDELKQRSVNELMIFSESAERQRSAFAQLSSIGNIDSLSKMKRAIDLAPAYGSSGNDDSANIEVLKLHRNTLKRRLSDQFH